jgi:hypothetical protein
MPVWRSPIRKFIVSCAWCLRRNGIVLRIWAKSAISVASRTYDRCWVSLDLITVRESPVLVVLCECVCTALDN